MRFPDLPAPPAIIPLGPRSPSGSSSRPGGSSREVRRDGRPLPPYLALLRMGFTVPPPLPAERCALTAPFHPCRPFGRRFVFCGTFLRVAATGCYPACCPCGVRTFLSGSSKRSPERSRGPLGAMQTLPCGPGLGRSEPIRRCGFARRRSTRARRRRRRAPPPRPSLRRKRRGRTGRRTRPAGRPFRRRPATRRASPRSDVTTMDSRGARAFATSATMASSALPDDAPRTVRAPRLVPRRPAGPSKKRIARARVARSLSAISATSACRSSSVGRAAWRKRPIRLLPSSRYGMSRPPARVAGASDGRTGRPGRA